MDTHYCTLWKLYFCIPFVTMIIRSNKQISQLQRKSLSFKEFFLIQRKLTVPKLSKFTLLH